MVANWWRQQSQITRSLIVGGPLATVGLLLVWIGAVVQDEVLQSVLSNVGTALLTTAVLGVMYEGFIKDALVRDVQISSGLSQRLINSGLRQVHSGLNGLNFLDIFANSTHIKIIPNDPLNWGEKHLEWIINLASKHAIDVTVYVPQARLYSRTISSLPGFKLEGPLSSEAYCAAKSREIKRTWESHQKSINERSSLKIIEYDGYPHTGLLCNDELAMVFTQPTAGPNHSVNTLVYLYDLRKNKDMRVWAESAIEQLSNQSLIETTDREITQDPLNILPLESELPAEIDETHEDGGQKW